MINQQIQNYKIISLIGEGGMGDVYLAEHVSIQRKVAIKVLKPELVKNEEIRLRFKNEAAMLAHLQHPNIVGLIDYVEQDGGLFLIMEYVEGQSLDDLIKDQQAPISIERAKKLMIQIVEAFIYAHKNGIVHRDVKPSNILVTNNDQIKVLDFGIAKLVGEGNHHLTKTGTQIGTVYYMSPEQVRGKVLDHRSDIYSLGVTFYELLTGVCPYKSMTSEYEIYDSIVKEPLLDLTQTMGSDYRSMWDIISKASEKDVNDRYQSCSEFFTDLKKDVVTTSTAKTEKPNVHQKRPSEIFLEEKTKSKTWLRVTLAITVVALGLFLVFKLSNTKLENYKDIDYLPENFLEIVSTSTPLEKINEMFGIADKVQSDQELGYTSYYFDLENAYLLIDTKDEITISTISIQSKEGKSAIDIGSFCGNNFTNGKIIKLGLTKFRDLDNNTPIEISRDRCNNLGFINVSSGRNCNYQSIFYGNIYKEMEIGFDEFFNENSVYFEGSDGFIDYSYFKDHVINYIIISNDDDLLKKSHPYGQGIHCDIIELK
jgi:serine/threonine protein kinase